MKENIQQQAEQIAAKIANALASVTKRAVPENETLPVTINIFIIEHGGNWNIGDEAIQREARK